MVSRSPKKVSFGRAPITGVSSSLCSNAEQEGTCTQDGADHHCDRGDGDEERLVVRTADAVVDPHAVVVEDIHALVAHPAVLAASIYRDAANPAERHVVSVLFSMALGVVLQPDVGSAALQFVALAVAATSRATVER
eukprot:CAMPEP_0115762174 /NCGR_PEP_ID=MMETSP0272-20121206/100893_1 /TAXON_ID=71861 /ORGANISM="Scrippsiella trochoidea, Strain CCMP3099" /LENGTH=136 /DNA_ID=CAMNT_0003207891 /DNA_START=228 /DNA_END=639 /DNA_ORIENTATION=+